MPRVLIRRVTPAVTASVMAALPWVAGLTLVVPGRVSGDQLPLVWCALSLVLAGGLAVTMWSAVRRDRRVALAAVSTASLLLADAGVSMLHGPSPWAVGQLGLDVAGAAGCAVLAWVIWRDVPAGGR